MGKDVLPQLYKVILIFGRSLARQLDDAPAMAIRPCKNPLLRTSFEPRQRPPKELKPTKRRKMTDREVRVWKGHAWGGRGVCIFFWDQILAQAALPSQRSCAFLIITWDRNVDPASKSVEGTRERAQISSFSVVFAGWGSPGAGCRGLKASPRNSTHRSNTAETDLAKPTPACREVTWEDWNKRTRRSNSNAQERRSLSRNV